MLAAPIERWGKIETYCCTQHEDWGEQDAADFAVCYRPCRSFKERKSTNALKLIPTSPKEEPSSYLAQVAP